MHPLSKSPNTGNRKKPSYFKTLPDNIAQSPTGIPRISNSPFPALDPTRSFKSVYERAGFDVYKGEQRPDKPIQDYKTRGAPMPGLRSHSTSQILTTQHDTARREKRNVSEFFTAQHHEKSKPNLTIDSNLANTSYKNKQNSTSREFVPSPLSSAHSANHQVSAPPSSHGSSRTELINSRSNSPQRSNHIPPVSAYSSALSLSQQLNEPTSSRVPPEPIISKAISTSNTNLSNNNLSKTFSHESVPTSYQQSETSMDELSRKSSPERIQLQRRSYNHSPKRNSRLSFQQSLDRIPSITEEEPVLLPETTVSKSIDILPEPPSSLSNPTIEILDEFQPVPHIIPKRAPPPVVSPDIVMQEQFEDEDFNALKSNFMPKRPIISQGADISLDSDIENDITNVSGDFDSSSLDSLAPKDQRFNFESAAPTPELTNKYAQDFKDDDSEDDDINNDEFNEDFSKVGKLLPPQVPLHQSSNQVPEVKVPDEKIDIASNDKVSKLLNSKFRNSNYSTSSSVYNSPHKSISTPFTPTFDNNFQSEQSSNTTRTPSDLRMCDYEELKQKLESVELKDRSNEEYTKPLQIQNHSLKQVSTDSSPEQITPLSPSQNSFLNQSSPKQDEIEPLLKETTPKLKHPSGQGPCRKCGLEIKNKPIYSKSGELSGQWHRSCFTCTSCNLKFSKKISCFVLNDEPFCEYHFHVENNSRCKICGNGIVGECLEDDSNDRYHVDCLKCSNCSNLITSDYLSINNKIHCEPCAFNFTSTNDNSTSKIEKRRTRIGFI